MPIYIDILESGFIGLGGNQNAIYWSSARMYWDLICVLTVQHWALVALWLFIENIEKVSYEHGNHLLIKIFTAL